MNRFGVITTWILLQLIAGISCDESRICENLKELPVCNETQYEAYRDCVEELKVIRHKRQALCPQLVAAQSSVQTPMPMAEQLVLPLDDKATVLPSVQVIPAITSVVTVKPIESNDIPIYHPPKKPQLKALRRKIIVQGKDEDDNLEYEIPTNITTVIRLTNVVNNTNIVNVPTNVNTTNVNNIHIYANITEGESKPTEEEKCCTAVQPKKCHPSTNGLKCKHKRLRMCGPQCTADVVHVQRRKRCDSQGHCKQKLAYVPQPEKPTCVYIEQWPFVACGKPANMKIICDGCYDHYGHGFEAYNGQMPNQCRGCYDDGFEYGPMYRRGPVLRPFYYHEPPCYITGTCQMTYGDCGYGCYGHEMIDPAWGHAPPSPYDPEMNDSNTGYFSQELDVSNGTESDWGVPVHKCTVLSDDNTLIVQNCTDTVENLYAAAPEEYPYYKPIQPRPHKSQYKVRKTMQHKAEVTHLDDNDNFSGEGQIIGGDQQAAFVVDADYDNDYDF